MKILVTGANGQLGNELHKQLDKEFPGCVLYTDVDTLPSTRRKKKKCNVHGSISMP